MPATAASIETRRCRFCRSEAVQISDTPTLRLYECVDISCAAVEVIGKGASWWYHGAQRPDGSAIDADGQRRQRGTYGWWDNAEAVS